MASHGSGARPATPAHLAEKIRRSGAALLGERKQVTILFADVSGSMTLAEQTDPEEWHGIVERLFGILAEGVHRFEGVVSQFTGDGIMALFGVPIAHEDHAVRACYAALALRRDLARYARELRRAHGLNFAVRLGLNSGEVVVGAIGDDLRMDYTAVGHTVGLARRIEQLAEPGRAYLTESTARLVRGYVRLTTLGPFALKGVSEPVAVYELEEIGTARTRLDQARARGLARFVGRTDEMAMLEVASGRAEGGAGQVVRIVGEAGIGKSRLAWELLERCRARDMAVAETHAVPHGQMVPFLPVLELLRDFFGITSGDGMREARRKVAGTLTLLGGTEASDTHDDTAALGVLFEFLGIAEPDRQAQSGDPELPQRQLLAITAGLVRARSRRRPVVLLVEDLHWLDGASETFLANLVAAVEDARVLLLLTHRPEYRPPWAPADHHTTVALQPLDRRDARALLDDLLGRDPALDELAARIQTRTGGNPFFLEEVVQALVEQGSLVGSRGAYRLVGPVDDEAIPTTVYAVLASRIDRLAPREKLVLQHAAVVGRRFRGAILEAVVPLPVPEVASALAALIDAEFIYEETLYPDPLYAFRHRLTVEVAYRSQLADRRASIHAGVAHAISTLDPDRIDEQSALLAQHWEGAGDLLEAARWCRRAAMWAGRRDLAEALRNWTRVRGLLQEIPPSTEVAELALAACTGILSVGWRRGLSREAAGELYAEGRRLAEAAGDPGDLAILVSAYGTVCTVRGEADAGYALQREAVTIADRTANLGLRLAVRARLVLAHRDGGEFAAALALADATLELVPAAPQLGVEILGYSPYVTLVRARAQVLAEMGRLGDALAGVGHALALARELREAEGIAWAHMDYVRLAQCTGDRESALAHAREMCAVAEREDAPYLRAQAYIALGLAHELREEWGSTVAAMDRALQLAHDHGIGLQFEALMLAALARAQAESGEEEAARATADAAVEAARRHGTRRWAYAAHLAVAQVALSAPEPLERDRIAHALGEALIAIRDTQAWSHEPFVVLAHARLAERLDDAVASARLRDEARNLFRRLGADAHVARLARGAAG